MWSPLLAQGDSKCDFVSLFAPEEIGLRFVGFFCSVGASCRLSCGVCGRSLFTRPDTHSPKDPVYSNLGYFQYKNIAK